MCLFIYWWRAELQDRRFGPQGCHWYKGVRLDGCCERSGLTFGDRFVPVEIQITYGAGLPAFHMVGMVSESVEESKEGCFFCMVF